jgi:hypothetical protein
MNKWFLTLFLIYYGSLQAEINVEDSCKSVNCDLYREEKLKHEAKLKEINCLGSKEVTKNCDQIKMASLTKDFQSKIQSIFQVSTVKKSIADDVQYHSLRNLFTPKSQVISGLYEILPVLNYTNIGVHWGGVANNAPLVDRIVNIDPNSLPLVNNSSWYLAQWKKTAPLMLNQNRKDPIMTDGFTSDQFLGPAKFEINSPQNKFKTETTLLIYRDEPNESQVFEIIGRNGWLNNVGGSNVFLASDIKDWEHNGLNNNINLTYNGKISKMNVEYFEPSNEVKNEIVVGQAFAAFTALYTAPTGEKTNLFVQILLADTRGKNILFNGCYKHGDAPEIVFGHNLDNDFSTKASTEAIKPKKYSLNKYLCYALKQKFDCPSDIKTPNFKEMSKNLKNWKVTGFYTGVETQVSKASGSNQEVPGPIKGEIEMGLQYSNLRISADTNKTFANCSEFESYDEINNKPLNTCTKGTFKNDKNKTVEYFCGCGEISGGALQSDGCYHKESSSITNTENNTNNPVTNKSSSGSFCVGVKKRLFICNAGPQDESEGWIIQSDGCYHKATENPCDL